MFVDDVGSPKFQLYCTIVWPAAARMPSALKSTVSPTASCVGEKTQSPVGTADPETDTCWVVDAETPRSLVTVNVTVKLVAGVVDAR